MDGKFDYERLAKVITDLNPDVVALQEVLNQEAAQALADALGYHATVADPDGRGNRVAFLTRNPIVGQPEQITAWRLPNVQVFDLDKERNTEVVPAFPRPVLKITVAHGGTEIDLINVHLKSKLLTFPAGKDKDRQFSTTDEELRAIAATGGVVGVTPIGRFLLRDPARPATIDDFVAQIDYLTDLIGIDHVGLASDSSMDSCVSAFEIAEAAWFASTVRSSRSDLSKALIFVRLST